MEKMEKIEKMEKMEKMEKIEKIEKIEKMEKIEKIEKMEKMENSFFDFPEQIKILFIYYPTHTSHHFKKIFKDKVFKEDQEIKFFEIKFFEEKKNSDIIEIDWEKNFLVMKSELDQFYKEKKEYAKELYFIVVSKFLGDKCEELIKKVDKIIFFWFPNEDEYLWFAVDYRIFAKDFNKFLKLHKENLKRLYRFLSKNKELESRCCFFQLESETFQHLLKAEETINFILNIKQDNNSIFSLQEIRQFAENQYIDRTMNDIEFVKRKRGRKFHLIVESELTQILKNLLQQKAEKPLTKNEGLLSFLELIINKLNSISDEERKIYKKIISHDYFLLNDTDYHFIEELLKISKDLISNLKSLTDELKQTQNENNENDEDKKENLMQNRELLSKVCDAIYHLCCHRYFCFNIWKQNPSEYVLFIRSLIESTFPQINYWGFKLLNQMLRRDIRRFQNFWKDANNDYAIPISKLIFNRILSLFEKVDDNKRTLEEGIHCLNRLLKDSPYHCGMFGEEVESLFQLLEDSVSTEFSNFYADCFGILEQLLIFGSAEISNRILENTSLIQFFAETTKTCSRDHSLLLKLSLFLNTWVHTSSQEQIDDFMSDEEDIIENENEVDTKGELIEDLSESQRAIEKKQERKTPGSWDLNLALKTYKINSLKASDNSLDEKIREIKERESSMEMEELLIKNERLQYQLKDLTKTLEDEKNYSKELKSKYEDKEIEFKKKVRDLENRIQELENRSSVKKNETKDEDNNNSLSLSTSQTIPTCDEENTLPILSKSREEVTEALAQEFIKLIEKKRKNLREMRDSISQSLKHLGSDLYSHPTHFLLELIQNADDNEYDSSVEPYLKIEFSGDFISFSNNEKGFCPKDVHALCKLAISTKIAGIHTGQKGLGFKSVYSCTDKPQICSNQWQFYFHKEADGDYVQFITPHWLNEEDFPPHLKNLKTLLPKDTHLYLPWKANFYKVNQIETTIHPLIMLTLKKLKRLQIKSQITNVQREFFCEDIPENILVSDLNCNDLEINKISKVKSIITVKSENNIFKKQEFYTFKITINIAKAIQQDVGRNVEKTEITLSFPLVDKTSDSMETIPIFASLPVQDIGLKFLINCDWILVTNRESIPANSWNETLRDHVASFCIALILSDEYLQKHVGYYVPDVTPEMSSFWKEMVNKIRSAVEKELISPSSFLPNFQILELIPKDLIEKYGEIQIVTSENPLFQLLKAKGKERELSCKEILECFSKSEFLNWLNTKSKKWWDDLFKLINDFMDKFPSKEQLKPFIELAKTRLIFSIRRNQELSLSSSFLNREHLPSSSAYFFSKKDSNYSWRSNFVIINYSSENEKEVLEKLEFLPFLPEYVIPLIIDIHVNTLNPPADSESIQTVWNDLLYLRNNWDSVETIKSTFKNFPSLYVPANNNNLISSSKAQIPSVLGYYIDNRFRIIDSGKLEIQYPYFDDKMKLKELIEWEDFFIKIGCKVPYLNKSASSANFQALALLPSFDTYESRDLCKKAEIILDHQRDSTLTFLSNLHILTKQNERVPVGKVSSDRITQSLLPSVPLPEYAYDLAKRYGVVIERDVSMCIKILKILVEKKEKNTSRYIEWLLYLNSLLNEEKNAKYLNEKETYNDLEIYLSSTFIKDENNANTGDFFNLKDIIILDSEISDDLKLISIHSKKNIISKNFNSEYWSLSELLKKLGCMVEFSIEDAAKTIDLMSKSRKYFVSGIGSTNLFLSEEGFESFFQIYRYLEILLVKYLNIPIDKTFNNQEWQCNLVNVLKDSKYQDLLSSISTSLSKIPMISNTKLLISSSNIRQCKYFLTHFLTINAYYNFPDLSLIHHKILLDFPCLTACLGLVPLESSSFLVWRSSTINPHYVLKKVTDLFRTVFEDDKIFVIQNYYLQVSVTIPSKTLHYSKINDNNAEPDCTKILLSKDEPAFLIILPDNQPQSEHNSETLVMCCTGHLDNASRQRLIYSCLKYLLQLKKNLSEPEAAKLAKENIETIQDFYSQEPWNEGEKNFCLKRVYFEPEDSHSSVLFDLNINLTKPTMNELEPNKEYLKHISLVSPKLKGVWDSMQNCVNELFRNLETHSNLDHLTAPPSSTDSNDNSSMPAIVNVELNYKIGVYAEIFFCQLLQKRFESNFDPKKSWISSNRLRVLPELGRENIQDSFGCDFIIKDDRGFFSEETKDCFIEVKGCQNFDGSFFISRNEINRFEDTRTKKDCMYVIVLIGKVLTETPFVIRKIIWQNYSDLKLNPETYEARLNDFKEREPHKEKKRYHEFEQSKHHQKNEHRGMQENSKKKEPYKKEITDNTLYKGYITTLNNREGFIYSSKFEKLLYFETTDVKEPDKLKKDAWVSFNCYSTPQGQNATNIEMIKYKGKIITFYPKRRYGIISSLDFKSVFFFENSVLDEEFYLNDNVEFNCLEQKQGPRAINISICLKY